MKMEQIKNRFTGEIMCGGKSLKVVLKLHKKWLSEEEGGIRAIMRGANLSGAIMSGADLRGADLRGADLSDAIMSGADLRGADLRGANLSDAIMRGAIMSGADLRDAIMIGANYKHLSGVPVIKNIHQAVYAAASQPGGLNMREWHTCGTTHRRAGWVVHLAGDAGRAMEFCVGTAAAAMYIYLASDPKLEKIPDFYNLDNDAVLADMKRLAEEEAAR